MVIFDKNLNSLNKNKLRNFLAHPAYSISTSALGETRHTTAVTVDRKHSKENNLSQNSHRIVKKVRFRQ